MKAKLKLSDSEVEALAMKTFALGEIVTLNGQQYKVVRVWKGDPIKCKESKARLDMVKHPSMYVIATLHFLREHCEY